MLSHFICEVHLDMQMSCLNPAPLNINYHFSPPPPPLLDIYMDAEIRALRWESTSIKVQHFKTGVGLEIALPAAVKSALFRTSSSFYFVLSPYFSSVKWHVMNSEWDFYLWLCEFSFTQMWPSCLAVRYSGILSNCDPTPTPPLLHQTDFVSLRFAATSFFLRMGGILDSFCPSVCLDSICWTTQPFLTIFGVVVHYHEVECLAENWVTVFNVKVTARVYIIKIWLFLLYILSKSQQGLI